VTSTLKSSIYRWSFHEINHPVFSEEKNQSDFGTQEKQKKQMKTLSPNKNKKQKQPFELV
jgi:hypothetical protein